MPYTNTAPSLPFSGRSSISRHCSHQAAEAARPSRARKSAQYLAWLQVEGPASDQVAAAHFGWPLSSINSIRNGLRDGHGDPRIVAAGIGRSVFGRKVTLWRVA